MSCSSYSSQLQTYCLQSRYAFLLNYYKRCLNSLIHLSQYIIFPSFFASLPPVFLYQPLNFTHQCYLLLWYLILIFLFQLSDSVRLLFLSFSNFQFQFSVDFPNLHVLLPESIPCPSELLNLCNHTLLLFFQLNIHLLCVEKVSFECMHLILQISYLLSLKSFK